MDNINQRVALKVDLLMRSQSKTTRELSNVLAVPVEMAAALREGSEIWTVQELERVAIWVRTPIWQIVGEIDINLTMRGAGSKPGIPHKTAEDALKEWVDKLDNTLEV